MNLDTATMEEREAYVTPRIDQFRLCNGCECLIYHTLNACPYCISYNMQELKEDFVLEPKHIDYFTMLE
jgi:hypothetical protein